MPFGEQPIIGGKSATISVAASDTAYKAGADFIADGTCDEVEINAAIAALPAAGGEVYLCEGTYNVCGPIVIDKDNVAIIGAGASTVIRVRDGHNVDINVITATNHTNLLIKDLRIDGNRANQTAGVMRGVRFDTITESKIATCWIENLTYYGIELRSSDDNIVTDNTVNNNRVYGIYVWNGDDNIIIGNTCQNNYNDNILVNAGSENNTIKGNMCEGSHGSGIHIALNCLHNVVIGNTCQGNNTGGIDVYNFCNYNTVEGNSVLGNGGRGILVDANSNHNTIVGNTVINNGLAADNTYDGIRIDRDASYNNIQGNTIRTTTAAPPPNRQRYGISIDWPGCTGNLVANNDLHQSGQSGGYQDLGTNTRGTITGEVPPTGNTLVVAASNSLDPVRADYYCDGASDETEINAAIAALGATGGTVKLLEGTFTVDGSIVLASNVALVGQGAGTVITIPNGHNTTIDIITGTNINRVLVKDLRVDGNRANQAGLITNDGIDFHAVIYSEVVGCWVENMFSRGIHLHDGSYHNNIAGNIIMGNGQNAINLSGSNHNLIADNDLINNGLDADNTYDGIYILTSDYNSIQGNTIRTTTAAPPPNRQRYGINVSNAACDGNLVVDNDLYQSGQTAYFNDAGTGTRLRSIRTSIVDDSDANATLTSYLDFQTIEMADAADVSVRFNFRVPDDFHELVRARVVLVPRRTGNIYRRVTTCWCACGEDPSLVSSFIDWGQVAVVGDKCNCLDINAALTGIARGDNVGVTFRRDGANALDTVDAGVELVHFYMEYV